MLKDKSFTDFINLFSPHYFKKNDKVSSEESKRQNIFFFIAEINDREMISKTYHKYITAFNSTDNILFVLTSEKSGVSICSFTTVIDTLIEIASASIILSCIITNEVVKMFQKSMGREKTNTKELLC